LKLKSLAVITLLVLGCSAAFAQGSATLGFASAGDEGLYCNYEQIQWGGADNFYFQGIDNLVTACGSAVNGTIEGVKLSVPVAADAPLSGVVYAGADNIIDAQYQTYSGEQWFTFTQTKPSKLLKHFGWVGYLGVDGYEYLGNYGYLSASIPSASSKAVLNKSNAGAAHQSQTRTKTIQ
jgi:hypothetical protein